MKRFAPIWNSLGTRIALLFLLLTSLALAIASYLAYENSRMTVEQQVFNHLISTNLLKAAEYESWITNRENTLKMLASSPSLRLDAAALMECLAIGGDCQEIENRLLDHLFPGMLEGQIFLDLSLLRAEDGQIVISTDSALTGKYRESEPYFLEGLQHTFTEESAYDLSYAGIFMHVATPVVSPQGEIIAVLTGHANFAGMTQIMQRRSGLSASEDTYLVNSFNYFVTEPRFESGYAHKKALHTEGVKACLEGNNGVRFYLDYRDIPVIGAYQWLPERDLRIMTEVDQQEAFVSVVAIRLRLTLIGFFVALVAGVVGIFFARGISKPVRELGRNAEKIGAGDLSVRADVKSKDEIGLLARSFNQMAASLQESDLKNRHLLNELETWSVELEKRVEERTQELKESQLVTLSTMEDLEEAKRKAEEANEEIKAAQIATMNIMMDVDEARKKAELANNWLQEEKRFSDKIINSIPGIFYIFDADGKFVRWNNNLRSVTGYSDNEISKMQPTALFQGEEQAHIAERIQAVFRSGASTAEAHIISKSGLAIPYYFTGYKMDTDHGSFLIGTGIDITERLAAERAIQESQAKYLDLYENAPDMYVSVDEASGRIHECNKTLVNELGYSREEILECHIFDLYHPDSLPAAQEVFQIFKESCEIHDAELQLRRKDGSKIYVSLNVTALRDEQGAIVRSRSSWRDITVRVRVEQQLAEKAKELSRSNEELERFAYVASHDLKEPLRMVASYLQLLERRYGEKLDQDAKEFIEYAVNGATRMKRLINDLLAYSRVGTRGNPFEATNLNSVLSQVHVNLRATIEESGAIISQDEMPTIDVDESQMVQLFQNLLANAIKFRKEGEAPQISIRANDIGNDWEFAVKDNGIGLDPQYKDRIFVIFQRLHTKEVYAGTGIGLAVSKRIVERHGGNIWVESKLGEGSTFYFSLPKRQANKNEI